jgi:hypothetical protein
VRVAARDSTPHAPIELTLTEMTERQRDVVLQGLRRRLVAAAFGSDSAIPPAGETSAKLTAALLDAVTRLGSAPTDADTDRVAALLDLFDLEQLHIPFDVQTRFHDAFPDTGGVTDARLAAIAGRLGFVAAPAESLIAR